MSKDPRKKNTAEDTPEEDATAAVEPTEEDTPAQPEEPEEPEEDATDPAPEETPEEDTEDGEEPETFPRSYVEKLRKEAGDYRVKAQRAEDLAAALWAAQVTAAGRLADPTDLPMPEGADPLAPDVVDVAITDLLARKPHLAARVPRGDIGQGYAPTPSVFTLGDALRARA